MKFFLVFIIFLLILIFKKIYPKKSTNKKLNSFKNKFLNKESKIEKIFMRDDEKTSSNPDINIKIETYENEVNINRKSNIHRARLSRFKKSKLNGEMIYLEKGQRIFKYVDGKKFYL